MCFSRNDVGKEIAIQFVNFMGVSEQVMIIEERIFRRLLVAKYWTTIMTILDAFSFLDLFAALLDCPTKTISK